MKHLFKAFLITSLLVMSASEDSIAGKNKSNEMVGYWSQTPLVVNCLTSSYTQEEVKKALLFWESRGHSFDVIFDQFDCSGALLPGSITIDTGGQQDYRVGNAGFTSLIINKDTREILTAKVNIYNSSEITLLHELGHSLGYRHCYERGDVMHPDAEELRDEKWPENDFTKSKKKYSEKK